MKARQVILLALAFGAVSVSIGSWLYKDKNREFHKYPPSICDYECATVTIDGKRLLHGRCTAWYKGKKVGKGQFDKGERVGHWEFRTDYPMGGYPSGTFRRTGVSVDRRYFSVVSTNDLRAISWCPDHWQPLPYAARMRVLREQAAIFEQQLIRIVKEDPQLANIADSLRGKNSSVRYELRFGANCKWGYDVAASNPQAPYLGIDLNMYMIDPLAPGDFEQPGVEGASGAPRGYNRAKIEGTFGISLVNGSSNPLVDKQIFDLFMTAAKNLGDWARQRQGK